MGVHVVVVVVVIVVIPSVHVLSPGGGHQPPGEAETTTLKLLQPLPPQDLFSMTDQSKPCHP